MGQMVSGERSMKVERNSKRQPSQATTISARDIDLECDILGKLQKQSSPDRDSVVGDKSVNTMVSAVENLLSKATDADDESIYDADDGPKVLEWAREVELQWLVKNSSMKDGTTEAVNVLLNNDKSNSTALVVISSQLQDIRECLHELGALSVADGASGANAANNWVHSGSSSGTNAASSGANEHIWAGSGASRANNGAHYGAKNGANGSNCSHDRAHEPSPSRTSADAPANVGSSRATDGAGHNRPRRKCHNNPNSQAIHNKRARKALTKCTAHAPVDSRSKNRTAGAKSNPDKNTTAPIKIEHPPTVYRPLRTAVLSTSPIPVKNFCLRNGTQVKSMMSQIRKCLVNHSSAPRKQ